LPVYILLFSFTAVVICLFLFFALADIKQVVSVTPDDVSYYFKIAANVSDGKGFSFDGISETNGFHPLWLYVLIPVYVIAAGGQEILFRIPILFSLLLISISAVLFYSILIKFYSKKIVLISGLIFFIFVMIPSVNGLESSLLILMISILFLYGYKADVFSTNHHKKQFIYGMILGLVLLTRLDMFFLAIYICLFCMVLIFLPNHKKLPGWLRLISIAGGTFLVIGPYFLYNFLHFRYLMPISGALKTCFPKVALSPDVLRSFNLSSGKINLVTLSFAVTFSIYYLFKYIKAKSIKNNHSYFELSMVVFSLAALSHSLHAVFIMKWAVRPWHFLPNFLFLALAIAIPLNFFLSNLKKLKHNSWELILYWAAIGVLILFGTFRLVNYLRPQIPNWQIVSYDAAIWVENNTPADTILAMKDTGNFSFFSQRSVINLDGVVNNYAYQDSLKNQELGVYLNKNKVDYLVRHSVKQWRNVMQGDYDQFSMSYYSHFYETWSDEVTLSRSNEIYRSHKYPHGQTDSKLIIWKLSKGKSD